MMDHITSEDCANARAYSEARQSKDPAPIIDHLLARLSEGDPKEVTAHNVVTTLLGELIELGVDLSPAFRASRISQQQKGA
jgi:uncharacterized protein (DUF2461 family)